MVELEFSKIVQWMIITLLTSGIVLNEELQSKCPHYRIHFCSCSIDEPAKATPLKMCDQKVSKGTNCQPCSRHIQNYLTCDKCPDNKCPICSVDDFGQQQSHNKNNKNRFMSPPEQVFFTFSTALGNILNITPNPADKMLPHMSHTSSVNPKYVTKGPKHFNKPHTSLMSIVDDQIGMLIKDLKHEKLEKQGEIYESNLFVVIDNNDPDIESYFLRLKHNEDTHGRFKRDEAAVEPGGIKGNDEMPREVVSKRPEQLHEPTSINEYPASSKEGNSRHYRKFKKPLLDKTHPIRPKKIGDKRKMHTNFAKDMDIVSKENRPNNSLNFLMNYQDKFKDADLLNASLFKYEGNPSFGSPISDSDDAFYTVREDSIYTDNDNVNNRYSRIKNGYSLSMPFEKLSTVSTPPHDMAQEKNSEVLNNPDNHEVGGLSRQDFSDNRMVPHDAVTETTFQLVVTAENKIVKGNGPKIMSSDIREGQLSESSLKPFFTDENPENVSLNLQKLDHFRNFVQQILDTTSSSAYTTDHDFSSKETLEYSVGENHTADLIDQKVTDSHRIISPDTDDQKGMSNLPTTTTERINNDKESLNLRLPKETNSSLPSLFTVQDSSEYATDQHVFRAESSEYSENQTNERKSGDMSSHLFDEQLGKTNLPIYSHGENYYENGDLRQINDSSSHLRNILFRQGSSGYVTPQHFLNDLTSKKSDTAEGRGTDTTKNLKIMSPYLQEQQRKQSKLPATLQKGDNSNDDVNFSTTVGTKSYSSHTLAGQDTSDYRSDELFLGSETSKYIVDDKGTIGMNDMKGIDKLTIMSLDKPDQQLGGSNLPTIPNDENSGNEGMNFRMLSDSRRQFPFSLDENGNNKHFLGDVSLEYKGEEKETTGTNEKIDNLTVGSMPYSEEFPGQLNLTILGASQLMVTNDIEHINKFVGMSSHPSHALPDSTTSSPMFENSEKFDTKRGNINPTTPHTYTENRHGISAIQNRASSEEQSKYGSSHLRYSDAIYEYSPQKYRIGMKLLRFADIDPNKPEVTHFRISNIGRNRRLAKDYPENNWCTISGSSSYDSLDCQIWSYQKVCVIQCHQNRYIQGKSQAVFSCHRKKNVWEPKLQPCEGDPQGNHAIDPQTIEKNKVQEPGNYHSGSKTELGKVDSSEQEAPVDEYVDGNDSQKAPNDYEEYEYVTEKSGEEALDGDTSEQKSDEMDAPSEYSDEDDSNYYEQQ